MSPGLAALAGLLVFAAAWELMGMRKPRIAKRVLPMPFTGAKLAGAGVGAIAAFAVMPAAPGRLAPILAAALVVSGFLGPDAWAERLARRRRRGWSPRSPMLLIWSPWGGDRTDPGRALPEIATGTAGPLASELALTIADIEAGARHAEALASLRERTGASELGAVGAALERSRRYGSPLAEQLHAQAATLRAEEQRRIEERAARAAPKIQLVVAMVLVPSALLAIAAALVAHSDALFAAF